MCHHCMVSWGGENHDITICTICRQGDTMENLPPIAGAVLVEFDLVEDSWCKCGGRCLFWLLAWFGVSCASAFACSIILFRTTSITVKVLCLTTLMSGCFVWKKQRWLIECAMPTALRYDGILDDL